MDDTKGERRERKRRKRREMRVVGRSIRELQEIIRRRAKDAERKDSLDDS
jgi:hypothetical protein